MTSTLIEPAKARRDDRFYSHEQAMKFNRVDGMMFNLTRDEVPMVDEAVARIAPLAKMSKSDALSWQFDTYVSLNKNTPAPSGMGDPMVRELMKRIRESEKYQELRSYTVMDDVASALGSVALNNGLAKGLPEEVKKKAEAARKAQEEADAANEAAKAAKDSNDLTPEQQVEAQESADEATAKAKAATVALSNAMRNNGRAIAQVVAKVVAGAADEAAAVNAACRTFGSGSTDASGGLPAAEKFRLAKLVQKSGPAFRKLVLLLGRLTAEAIQKQASKTQHEAGAVVDVTLGSDISNVLEDELVQLKVPGLRLAALARLADDSAMQYEVENKEPLAKGDVVVLLDESGSMAGQREAEAKAVALAIAHVCAKQKRRFVVHFFQSTVTHTVEIKPGDANASDAGVNVALRKLGEIAGRGTGGGTDFDAPLAQAVQTVRNGGLDKADVLFVTDGECYASEQTIKAVQELRQQTGAKVYGMIIGAGTGSQAASVKAFCDKVWSCDSLLNGPASEMFEML